MTDHRSPEEIEHDIEQRRAGLTDTLEDLQDRFSIDGIVRQVGDQLRTHGGDIGASVSRAARDNPMALALTGVGLAWMIFGTSDRPRRNRAQNARHDNMPDDDDRWDRDVDWSQGRTGNFAGADHDSRPGTARGIAGAGQTPGGAHRYDDPYATHPVQDDDAGDDSGPGMGERARHMRENASGRASAFGRSMSDRADRARDGMSDMADRTASRAARMRRQFSEGTESLGEEARARVVAARERAYDARSAAMDQARRSSARAADMYDEQPLIAGALALALGAAVGAALPRTRLEDRYMGDESDALMHEAERIFAEERDKAGKVVHAAMDEAGDIIDEAQDAARDVKAEADRKAPGDNAADAANKKVREAGQRVADAARSEAKKQELGKADV